MKSKRKEKPKEQKQPSPKDSELEELHNKIDDLQNQKDELFEKLQRVSADYANFQKRAPKQIADSVAYEKENIIKTLLPALDNFEHTLQSAHSAENADDIIKGIQIIYDQMLNILKLHSVEQIKAIGETFDPTLHQAMMRKAEAGKEEDIVLEEFQKGYKLNGRVIRPSKVTVNKLKTEQEVQQAEEGQEEFQEEDVDLQEHAIDESTDME